MKSFVLPLLAFFSTASLLGCAADPATTSEAAGSADLTAASTATLQVSDSTILAGSLDVVRIAPGQAVSLENVSASSKTVLMFGSNVIDNEVGKPAEYPQATKLVLAAGERIVLGSAAHPLAKGSTFLGFDAPDLAKPGFRQFAKAAVWVGRKATRSCNVTVASLGSDQCPAWSVDEDFCTCTPAFGGGG